MRVTTFGANAQYLNNLNSVMDTYQNLEQELATGRSLNQPSDNPVAMSQDIQLQTSQTLTNEWSANATAALSKMQTADSIMGQLQTVLGNIRTQLVQAMNGTNTTQDIQNIGKNVFQMVNNVVQLANTNDGESYIFAGTNGKNPPLTMATTAPGSNLFQPPNWNGQGNLSVTIGNNVTLDVNIDGSVLFNTSPDGGITPSLLNTLQAINNDLNSNPPNTANLDHDLANLDTNIDNVSAMRADLGGRMNRAQAAQTQMAAMSKNLQIQQGQVEDANIAQVVTQLTTQQTVYQAALASGKNLILSTLADVLS
jgi:flagellar hook-associated protein 3 FlgL